jgi:hypothetical protein
MRRKRGSTPPSTGRSRRSSRVRWRTSMGR